MVVAAPAPTILIMPEWVGPYKLKVKVISAALTRSTDLLSKMDPYAQIEFTRAGVTRQLKGPTHKSGHKTPAWNWEIDLYYGGEATSIGAETLKVSVFEEDLVTGNDLVGESPPILMS